MGKGIKNRGCQVHHVRRDDLLAKEAEKEIASWSEGNTLDNCHLENGKWVRNEVIVIEDELYFLGQDVSKLSQKQRSQLRSYGN
mgnify:CR=1 FL=1